MFQQIFKQTLSCDIMVQQDWMDSALCIRIWAIDRWYHSTALRETNCVHCNTKNDNNQIKLHTKGCVHFPYFTISAFRGVCERLRGFGQSRIIATQKLWRLCKLHTNSIFFLVQTNVVHHLSAHQTHSCVCSKYSSTAYRLPF